MFDRGAIEIEREPIAVDVSFQQDARAVAFVVARGRREPFLLRLIRRLRHRRFAYIISALRTHDEELRAAPLASRVVNARLARLLDTIATEPPFARLPLVILELQCGGAAVAAAATAPAVRAVAAWGPPGVQPNDATVPIAFFVDERDASAVRRARQWLGAAAHCVPGPPPASIAETFVVFAPVGPTSGDSGTAPLGAVDAAARWLEQHVRRAG